MSLALSLMCHETHTPQSFTRLVIEPVLCALGSVTFSRAATELLLGTALHESGGLAHRRQISGGPARGFFQMEPATHNDIWDNFLAFRATLRSEVEALLSDPRADRIHELEFNDNYAAGMARVHYLRAPDALPQAGDLIGQSNYWKRHYNTPLGAGTPAKYRSDWASHGGSSVAFRSGCS